MKDKFVGAALAAFTLATVAQPDWITVGASANGDTWQLDATNTKRVGNHVTYWARELFVKPFRGASSNLVEIHVDCGSNTAIVQTSVWFDDDGNVLYRSGKPTVLSMPPGSPFRKIAKDLCSTEKPR